MSPARINESTNMKSDRFPPCLFPALHRSQSQRPQSLPPSSAAESASEFCSITEAQFLLLPEIGGKWHESGYRIDVATLCKAAWLLTLQCFVQTDILCFTYQEVTVGVAGSDGNHVLYFTRVDGEEEVQSFLHRLGESARSTVVLEPRGHEIRTVEKASADGDAHTNTMLLFYRREESDGGIELDLGESRAGNKPEDVLRMDIVASIFESTTRDHGHISAAIKFRNTHISQDVATSVLRTFQHIATQMLEVAITVAGAAATTNHLHTTMRLRDIDVCSPHDRRLIGRLTASVSPAEEQCLHDMIVAQCKRHPERTAVVAADGESLTYGELEDVTRRLAYRLVQLGVRPETFVLSCFEKSIWAVVARLAILRAGGAYVSIHAANPPAYLGSVVSRTGARVLVCDARHARTFRHLVPTTVEVAPGNVLDMRRLFPAPATLNRDTVCDTVRPSNACLVLFTSGSTGTPKGIVQVHRSYATAIRDYIRNLSLGADTRYLSFDDYAFDISNLEFLVPLIAGGCCCVPTGPMSTVHDLARNINILSANATFLTPTVAVKLSPADVPGLELLCVGGEALPAELATKWATKTTGSGNTRLVNQYGMGEVAICCCYNNEIVPNADVNVGRPASGAVFVVDAASPDKLLPVGAVGELLMEGPHLARGYLDNQTTAGVGARRTEAVFLDVPPAWMAEMHPDRAFASASARARMYRSGDLGRRNHDGTVDYVGRKDHVLKLDGCRLNALEVEHQARGLLSPQDTVIVDLLGLVDGREDPVLAALLHFERHPAAAPVSVPISASDVEPLLPNEPTITLIDIDPLAHAHESGDNTYAAVKAVNIAAAVAAALPAYMVPTLFLRLSHVPRTASKKTDRRLIRHAAQKFHLAMRAERGRRNPAQARRAQEVLN